MTPMEAVREMLREKMTARPVFDVLQTAASFWYESRNTGNIPAMDEALKKVMPQALLEAPAVHDFQSWEEAHFNKAYHDAGAVLLAKSYTLLYCGEIDRARPVSKLLSETFPFSMKLERNRYVLWTRSALRYHEQMCALHAAIVTHHMPTVVCPPERDEFDGIAQMNACRHTAILRLKEGNCNAGEDFARMAVEQRLRTCSGEWVINLIFEAMQPLEEELFSEPAWQEVDYAIRDWQAQKPDSGFAKIAEASFLYHWAWHAADRGTQQGDADFRARADRGRRIMQKLHADTPAWYSMSILLMAQNNARPLDIAKVFSEGHERHPDYTPLPRDLCLTLTRCGEEGKAACSDVIHGMKNEGRSAEAAGVLWRLHREGCIEKVRRYLRVDDVRAALKGALKAWPDSLKLRSDMAFLAVLLGQKDIAFDAMQGMAGKWDRALWKSHEDIARELCAPRPE